MSLIYAFLLFSMTFSTATAVTGTGRSFEIKVTQISCFDENRPTSGCFQYHDGLTGRITTFNWDATSSLTQIHLANQKYMFLNITLGIMLNS